MKWRRWAIAAVVVLLVEYPLALLFGPKSDAFREAERFVRDNPAVREYVGSVRKVTISPFGFYMHDWGDGSAARFDLEISGDLRDAEIHTELAKGSMWVVRFATLAREHESPIQLR